MNEKELRAIEMMYPEHANVSKDRILALIAEVRRLKSENAGLRLYLTHIGYSEKMETYCPQCGETKPLRFDTDGARTWGLCSICGNTLLDSIEHELPD